MEEFKGKPELAKAVVAVMSAVNGIEKNSSVGSGNYAYKGVKDKDVKAAYKRAMAENGLCILPVDIDDTTEITRWEEEDRYKKMKQKMSVFTKVTTKYLLMHTSGESQVLTGYGHSVDSGDKGAGKATTYALKYALLYTFMTPTGDIDDSDKTHSEDQDRPPVAKPDEKIIAEIDKALSSAKSEAELKVLYKTHSTTVNWTPQHLEELNQRIKFFKNRNKMVNALKNELATTTQLTEKYNLTEAQLIEVQGLAME